MIMSMRGKSLLMWETFLWCAGVDGVLRGLIADGVRVSKGLKCGAVDPRGDACYCYGFDKGLSVAGGVLGGYFVFGGSVWQSTITARWESCAISQNILQRLRVQGMTLYWLPWWGLRSTPRNAGSQMLVSEAGLVCGTTGGGAIEGHAIAEARTMVGKDVCRVENLALDPAENSIGMVCGGDAYLYAPICAESEAWAQVSWLLVAEVLRAAHPCVSCIGMPRWWLAVQRQRCLVRQSRRTCGRGVQLAGQEACRLEAEARY